VLYKWPGSYIHIYIHAYIYVWCMHTLHKYIHACMYVCVHVSAKLLCVTVHAYIHSYIHIYIVFLYTWIYLLWLFIHSQCISHVCEYLPCVSSSLTSLALCYLVSVQQHRSNCHWYLPLHSTQQHHGTHTDVQKFLWAGCHMGIQRIIHFWLNTGYRHDFSIVIVIKHLYSAT